MLQDLSLAHRCKKTVFRNTQLLSTVTVMDTHDGKLAVAHLQIMHVANPC